MKAIIKPAEGPGALLWSDGRSPSSSPVTSMERR